MRYLLLIPAFLITASVAAAQDAYTVGDRVRVTLRNKNTIVGHIKLPSRLSPKEILKVTDPDKYDLSKETSISLDLSLENRGLGSNASLTIKRAAIKVITVLNPLTPEEMAAIKEAIKRDEERRKTEEKERADYEKKRTDAVESAVKEAADTKKAAIDSAKSEAEAKEIEKAITFYYKFAPPAWGPDRLDEIFRKTQLKLPVTAEEKEFGTNYPLWNKGKQYIEEAKKKAEEKKEGDDKP